MTKEYPWYEIVEGDELEQGDFLDNCEVLVSTSGPVDSTGNKPSDETPYQLLGGIAKFDVVIISQSCDLQNGKLDYVLMSPRWSYQDYIRANPEFGKIDKLEQIRQGKIHRYYMLNSCDFPDLACQAQIVDLGTVFSVPYGIMKQTVKQCGRRLRLCSPYKEKLAQAFAYCFMRIALPTDIPKFEKGKILL